MRQYVLSALKAREMNEGGERREALSLEPCDLAVRTAVESGEEPVLGVGKNVFDEPVKIEPLAA